MVVSDVGPSILREARGSEGFAWVPSHVFRRTCATILDAAGRTPRAVAALHARNDREDADHGSVMGDHRP